mmetsp:Transcript_6922/g.20328  ORF Transcript_6922/g.20328 Transcript_6922/m.20328 type:complete len:240 (-) Transcript_6922:842-1561(-)
MALDPQSDQRVTAAGMLIHVGGTHLPTALPLLQQAEDLFWLRDDLLLATANDQSIRLVLKQSDGLRRRCQQIADVLLVDFQVTQPDQVFSFFRNFVQVAEAILDAERNESWRFRRPGHGEGLSRRRLAVTQNGTVVPLHGVLDELVDGVVVDISRCRIPAVDAIERVGMRAALDAVGLRGLRCRVAFRVDVPGHEVVADVLGRLIFVGRQRRLASDALEEAGLGGRRLQLGGCRGTQPR